MTMISSLVDTSAMDASLSQLPHVRAILSDVDGTIVHYAKTLFSRHGGYEIIPWPGSGAEALVKLKPGTGTGVQGNENDMEQNSTPRASEQRMRPFRPGPTDPVPEHYIRRDTYGRELVLLRHVAKQVLVPCYRVPSLTLGGGYISARTLQLIDALRRRYAVKFIIMTGARTSTMLLRRRSGTLPVAAVDICEGGGKMWWRDPVLRAIGEDGADISGVGRAGALFAMAAFKRRHEKSGFIREVRLKNGSYSKPFRGVLHHAGHPDAGYACRTAARDGSGCKESEATGRDVFRAFKESVDAVAADADWSKRFEKSCGPVDQLNLPPEERTGQLWNIYRCLKAEGYALDGLSFSTSFLVDLAKSPCVLQHASHTGVRLFREKRRCSGQLHKAPSSSGHSSHEEPQGQFYNNNDIDKEDLAIAVSNAEESLKARFEAGEFGNDFWYVTNLGKGQVSPIGSGKANAALYVLRRLLPLYELRRHYTPIDIRYQFDDAEENEGNDDVPTSKKAVSDQTVKSAAKRCCVALFDDDNDLPFAQLCGAGLVPSVAHSAVVSVLNAERDRSLYAAAHQYCTISSLMGHRPPQPTRPKDASPAWEEDDIDESTIPRYVRTPLQGPLGTELALEAILRRAQRCSRTDGRRGAIMMPRSRL